MILKEDQAAPKQGA